MNRHCLRGIRPNEKKAICEICGPVDVYWRSDRKRWKCAQAERSWGKSRKRNQKGKGFAKLRGKSCEICGSTDSLCGDHDHETNTFRGTLCRTCNSGIGMFKDKIELLEKAIEYLKTKSPAKTV